MIKHRSELDGKKILVTGSPGFIGASLVIRLLKELNSGAVVSLDNMNDYYEVSLKERRLKEIEKVAKESQARHIFVKGNIGDKVLVDQLFADYNFDIVVNLAAQAGVRYSIDHPDVYIESNIIGFYNILEACRHNPVEHLVYASSSSVYGMQQKTPFSISDPVDTPISLYAATKKSNELMAYTYSHLYGIPTTGLRFFTVYGPWGRPDMAYFTFTNKMIKGDPIQVFNHGDMKRDFTYIDDIVQGIVNLIDSPPAIEPPYRLYNIGNNQPVDLMYFIKTLEKCLMREGLITQPAKMVFLPMQAGDVYQTYADVDDLMRDFGFKPTTTVEEGLSRFATWYKQYYVEGGNLGHWKSRSPKATF
ncbi:MAG: NAD-dependent epimerase/dehydratase family protein [Saccharofermentanales bacterium]|jgi:UDP-glucuronate 4-epimerase